MLRLFQRPPQPKGFTVTDGVIFAVLCAVTYPIIDAINIHGFDLNYLIQQWYFMPLVLWIWAIYKRNWLLLLKPRAIQKWQPLKLFDFLLIVSFVFWLYDWLQPNMTRTLNFFALHVGGMFVSAIWFYARRVSVTNEAEVLSRNEPPPPDPTTLPPSKWFLIKPGRPHAWNEQNAVSLMDAIIRQAQGSAIEFSIEASNSGIQFLVFLHFGFIPLETMRGLVKMFYPDADVEENKGIEPQFPYQYRYIIFKRSSLFPFFEGLRSARDIGKFDPLAMLTQAMDVIESDESLVFSISWLGSLNFNTEQVDNLLTMSKLEAGQSTPRYYKATGFGEQLGEDLVRMWADSRARVARFNAGDERRHRAKLSQTLHTVAVSVSFKSSNPERLDLLTAVAAPVKNLCDPQVPLIEDGYDVRAVVESSQDWIKHVPRYILERWENHQEAHVQQLAESHTFLVSTDEFAAIWHLPHEGFKAQNLEWGARVQVQMSKSLQKTSAGILLGFNRYGTAEREVRLSDKERKTHLLITGRTGTGKSSLLHNLIHQDIASGQGVCVIDPHGDLVDAILRYSIPPNRVDDVVVLDIGNEEYPPPLNPLYRPERVENDISANLFMSVLIKMYPELVEQETGDTLANALLLLTEEENPTLLDFLRVFDDDAYRQYLLDKTDDFTLKSVWKNFSAQGTGRQADMIRPALRRIRSFYRNKSLRAITCHPSSLDIHQLISDNRIILVSLRADAAKVPEDERRVLGAILVSQIYMATIAGAISREPFVLYIDEMERLTTTALPEMLSEARKAGLGVVMAHQYLNQLPKSILEAVSGNVGTLLCLEVGEESAKFFAPYMQPGFDYKDLMSLGLYKGAISMRSQTERAQAFTLEPELPPPLRTGNTADDGKARELHLRGRSVVKYTPWTYSRVMRWLNQRYGGGDNDQGGKTPPDAGGSDDDQIEPKR